MINQLISQLIIFVIFIPIQLFFFNYFLEGHFFFFWFLILLFFECFSHEIYRILIALNNQISATITFCIKSSLWIYILILSIYFFPKLSTINSIFIFWTIGAICSTLFGLIIIYNYFNQNKNHDFKFNIKWILKGYKTALIFFLSALFVKGLFLYDKFYLKQNYIIDYLGVYFFYYTLIFGVFNILEPAIFSFFYPRLVKSYQNLENSVFKQQSKKLLLNTFILSLIISLVLILILPSIIDFINKPLLKNYLIDAKLLILAGFLFSVSMIPHYILYSKKKIN